MPNEPNAVVRLLLEALLDQFEQPERRRVARVRLDRQRHHAYFQAADVGARRDANDELQRLAERGCLKLHWQKWEAGNWLEKIDLVPEQAAAVYERLGRAPRSERQAALRELLAAPAPASEWHAEFLAWSREQLDAHRSVAPLKLSSDAAGAEWNRDLLRALAAVAGLQQPVLERKLSVQLFGDSKRFEALRGAVLTVLRRHDAESRSYGEDDGALLRAHLVERAPEYVPLSGPLALRLAEATLDLLPFVPSVALPATILRQAAVVGCDAEALVTIENATSFSEFAAARPASVLALFTGGFASPAVITLLGNIRAVRSELPFFHWGDLDAGGLRILAHLREKLGAIRPLAMDVATFAAHRQHARRLSESEREALAQLHAHPALADCAPLIEQMLATNEKLEQEAVDVNHCFEAIRRALRSEA